MIPYVFPTANRPQYLESLLHYMALYSDGMRLVIADGSDAEHRPRVREIIDQYRDRLEIDYREYPNEMHLHTRLIDVFSSIDDEIILTGGDDDYPVVEGVQQAYDFMCAHSEYSYAAGNIIKLMYEKDGDCWVKPFFMRSAEEDTALGRAKYVTANFSPSYYAMHRRDKLIDVLKQLECTKHSMVLFDIAEAILSVLPGKSKIFPDLMMVRIDHPLNQPKYREGHPLFIPGGAEMTLEVTRLIASLIATHDDIAEDAAYSDVEGMLKLLLLKRPHSQVRNQYQSLIAASVEELFSPESALHAQYGERLRAISEGIVTAIGYAPSLLCDKYQALDQGVKK